MAAALPSSSFMRCHSSMPTNRDTRTPRLVAHTRARRVLRPRPWQSSCSSSARFWWSTRFVSSNGRSSDQSRARSRRGSRSGGAGVTETHEAGRQAPAVPAVWRATGGRVLSPRRAHHGAAAHRERRPAWWSCPGSGRSAADARSWALPHLLAEPRDRGGLTGSRGLTSLCLDRARSASSAPSALWTSWWWAWIRRSRHRAVAHHICAHHHAGPALDARVARAMRRPHAGASLHDWRHVEAQCRRVRAHALVEAQDDQAWNGLPRRQCRRKVQRVERTHRLDRERPSGALQDRRA